LNKRASNPNFSAISGSRLYGTEVETSDIDIRGFTILPFEYLLGIKDVKCVEFEGDHKIYSLKRYFELILNGDPMTTELLFCPKDKILSCDEIGQRIIGIGLKYALSNKSFSRIMGYSNGEWRKAMAVKLVPEKKKKGENEILNDFWNCYDFLDKEQKDLIIKTINDGRPFKLEPSMSGLGQKRKAQVEKYGYCTKSAAHSIRLLKQVTELMLSGNITFPRPEAKLLRDIRNGELDKKEIEVIYNESRSQAEAAREFSTLPDKPDMAQAMEEYSKVVKEIIVDYLK